MKIISTIIISIAFNLVKAQDIKIGNQVWTSKNLDVFTYRNGDSIPQVQDQEKWNNLTTGAWCYYENKSEYGKIYGKLYNWYAINDPRGLAPKGYHIPTKVEWETLISYLGEKRAGKKMKTNYDWHAYDDSLGVEFSKIKLSTGINTSGFTGLPGGYRDYKFFAIGIRGSWWSSNSNDMGGYYYYLTFQDDVLNSNYEFKFEGRSVRCIKD